MRLVIAAVGRLKDGAERDLLERYATRFEPMAKRLGIGPVTWIEIPESKAASVQKRMAEEGEALQRAARDATFTIALDVKGKALGSEAIAKTLAAIRDDGNKSAAVLIGGPDGMSPSLLEATKLRLSLGAITLPHGLARIVLAEQFYRAATILSGHPYHRA